MPKLTLVKKWNNSLIPSLEQDLEYIEKIPNNSLISADIKMARNLKFLRKFFAMLEVMFQYQHRYKNKQHFRTDMMIRCGFYTDFITKEGEIIYIPESISFAKMDELKFALVYNSFIDIFISDYVPQITKAEIEAKVIEHIIQFS